MPLAMVLTVEPAAAAVRVDISGAAAGTVTIARSDANGNGVVRQAVGQVVSAGSLVVRDYEAALTGFIFYTATDSSGATVGPQFAVLENVVTLPQVAPVGQPQYGVAIDAVVEYDATRGTGSVVHDPLGATKPIVIVGRMKLRQGNISFYAATYGSVGPLENVFELGSVLMVRQPTYPGMDMYCVVTDSRVAPRADATSPRRWDVTATYVETAAPDVPLAGAAGWTYQGVKDSYADYSGVRFYFASFKALLIGP